MLKERPFFSCARCGASVTAARPPPAAQVLELIAGGELFDKIVAESRFDEKTARFYFRQLIKGVKCELLRARLCRSGVAHRRRVRAHLRGSR